NGEANGIAEEMILRDRFYRCGNGITTWNYNTLDIYIWYSYFEDNRVAIQDVTGAFHAYENRFVRSKTADLASYTNMESSVVNNISLGSASFASKLSGNLHFQGNKIYGTTSIPFDLGQTAPATMIDNLVRGPDNLPQVQIPGFVQNATYGANTALIVGN